MHDDLDNQLSDHLVAVGKATLGFLPYVGAPLAEVLGIAIPNQRIDRVIKYVRILNARLLMLESEVLNKKLKEEGCLDLIQESVMQSALTGSDDRREYIANLIINGLSEEEVNYENELHILKTLGEINNSEIIWLKSYSIRNYVEHKKYAEEHPEVMQQTFVPAGADMLRREHSVISSSYKIHLTQLGLLQEKIELELNKNPPRYNHKGHDLTPFGALLLSRIGLSQVG